MRQRDYELSASQNEFPALEAEVLEVIRELRNMVRAGLTCLFAGGGR